VLSGPGCLPGWNARLANPGDPPDPHGAIPQIRGFSQLQSLSRSASGSRLHPIKASCFTGKNTFQQVFQGESGTPREAENG